MIHFENFIPKTNIDVRQVGVKHIVNDDLYVFINVIHSQCVDCRRDNSPEQNFSNDQNIENVRKIDIPDAQVHGRVIQCGGQTIHIPAETVFEGVPKVILVIMNLGIYATRSTTREAWTLHFGLKHNETRESGVYITTKKIVVKSTTMRILKKDLQNFANGNHTVLHKYNKRELAKLYENLGGNITFQRKPVQSGNKMMNKIRSQLVYYGPGNRVYNKNDIIRNLEYILVPNQNVTNVLQYFGVKNKYL